MNKQCRTCKEIKSSNEFSDTINPKKGNTDGKQEDCKTCMNIKRIAGINASKKKKRKPRKKKQSVAVLPFVTSQDSIIASIEDEILTMKKNIKSLQASKRKLAKGNITVTIKNGLVSLTL